MMTNLHSLKVSHQELVKRLKGEVQRLDDATSYRKETAQIALEIVENANTATVFLDEQITIELLKKGYPETDEERAKDVAKYLRVITHQLAIQSSMSPALQKRIRERMNNGKITLEKVR